MTNKEMTVSEANRIIGEFMGVQAKGKFLYSNELTRIGSVEYFINKGRAYSESLDALVPVWERLKSNEIVLDFDDDYWCQVTYLFQNEDGLTDKNSTFCEITGTKSIQQAAAIATAKAIQAIEGE